MEPRWLFRMSRWARNPPSPARVKLVFAIIALALAIGAIEWLGYWPDWATAERIRPRF
ncbi:hypothetical protein ACFSUD_07115 [Sulfitobacter aestuarii]|uniref:Uncharacterized protein n=1 Tax=Sulfitobacter aestuarii TaxID=2161676 RepID=A0ABW5U302_9RHOB